MNLWQKTETELRGIKPTREKKHCLNEFGKKGEFEEQITNSTYQLYMGI